MRISVALAREVLNGRDARICRACAGILDVSGAGISVMSPTNSGRLCVSNARMDVLEELQFTLGEGPCQDAFVLGVPTIVADLQASASRWPTFSSEAVSAGVQAVFAYPLGRGDNPFGVLTLYQDAAGPLSPAQQDDCVAVVDVLSETMLSLVASVPRGIVPPQLDDAVAHRAELHQASGMVAVQLGVSVADALVRLRAYAFAHDRPLGAVAGDIVGRRIRFNDADLGGAT